MFALKAFPALDGDCLLLTYGNAGRESHVLVDGGRAETYRYLRPALAQIAATGGRLELLILSHIDADHIAGLLKFVRDDEPPIAIGDVWFNGYDQLADLDALQFLGPSQGDDFSQALRASGLPWNAAFGGRSVVLPENGEPPELELEGGMRVALLSPDPSKLRALAKVWDRWRSKDVARRSEEKHGALRMIDGLQTLGPRRMPRPIEVEALARTEFEDDDEPPNGASIALVAEWEGRRLLLAADAHPALLTSSVERLARRRGTERLSVDVLKVPHHGSAPNNSRDFLRSIDCRRFLFSTNGSRHGHPDPNTVARILTGDPLRHKTLCFNYRQSFTEPWNCSGLRETYGYDCLYGDETGTIILNV